MSPVISTNILYNLPIVWIQLYYKKNHQKSSSTSSCHMLLSLQVIPWSKFTNGYSYHKQTFLLFTYLLKLNWFLRLSKLGLFRIKSLNQFSFQKEFSLIKKTIEQKNILNHQPTRLYGIWTTSSSLFYAETIASYSLSWKSSGYSFLLNMFLLHWMHHMTLLLYRLKVTRLYSLLDSSMQGFDLTYKYCHITCMF